MDIVCIQGIRVFGLHGWHQHERVEGNTFEVDLEAELLVSIDSMKKPSDSFDYEVATTICKQVIEGQSRLFLEELALDIGQKLWKADRLKSLKVCLRKMHPPVSLPAQSAEVCLCWPRPTSP